MRVVRVAPDTVYVHADENSSLGITPDEAIALRDLLLREFPINPVPYKSGDDLDRAIAGEPDPDEVRRILDHNPHNNNPVAAAARAWLRSREQQAEAAIDRLVESKWRQMQPSRERRERIATTLFAGMLANRDTHATAVLAVSYADSLMVALDKEQP